MSLPNLDHRFWRRVVKLDDCWLWLGGKTKGGYGSLSLDGKHGLAHRWSYTFHYGPIPKGLVLDHLCRIRSCVNPEHLEVVTHRVNLLRGVGHGTETSCPRGHEYTSDNTDLRGGKRYCRACAPINDKNRAPRRRATMN